MREIVGGQEKRIDMENVTVRFLAVIRRQIVLIEIIVIDFCLIAAQKIFVVRHHTRNVAARHQNGEYHCKQKTYMNFAHQSHSITELHKYKQDTLV